MQASPRSARAQDAILPAVPFCRDRTFAPDKRVAPNYLRFRGWLAPKALGYFHEGKLILLFTFESDLGDGWEDANVHNDPEAVRLKALKMGANIIKYAFEN